MTSKFDWDKYENVQSSNKGFDWNSYETVSQDKTNLEKTGRVGAQVSLGALDTALLPYTVAAQAQGSKTYQQAEYRQNLLDELERLSDLKRMGQWDEQDEKNLQSIIAQLNDPQAFEEKTQHIKPYDITPSSLAKKGIKETTGYDLEPEDLTENIAELGGAFLTPTKILNLPKTGKKLLDLATKEGRQAHKTASQWKALEKGAKGNTQKTEILDFAKNKNLTPEEATLLLQSEGKIKKLEKISKKTDRFKKIAGGLKEKLKDSYEELKSVGKQGGYLSVEESNALQRDLESVITDIDKTFVEGPDTKGAREMIEKTIFNIENKAGTIEDLINSRRNLRQFTNWNKLHEGDSIRAKAEKAIFDAIERKNPQIAKELQKTDKAYSQYKKFEKLLEKKPNPVHWHGIPVTGLLGNLIFLGAGFTTGHLAGAANVVLSKELIQRLSTRLLTDPKFQSIRTRMMDSLKSGSQKNQKGALVSYMKMLKHEDPELYEELNSSIIESEKA